MDGQIDETNGAQAPKVDKAARAKKAKAKGKKGKGAKAAAKGGKPVKRGSGARIRELLKQGKETDEILKVIHKEFPGSKAKASDVSWNRGFAAREKAKGKKK